MTAPGPSSGAPGSLPPVGSLAAEAAQLLDALAARLAQVRVTVGDHAPGGSSWTGEPGSDLVDGQPVGVHPAAARPDAAGQPDAAADTDAAGHRQCVGWCPVCRSADLLRGERPEVAGKLVDSAIVVVSALRSLLPATDASATETPETTASADRSPAAGGSGSDQPGDSPLRPPGIERIDIR